MAGEMKMAQQALAGRLLHHIRRLDSGVALDVGLSEQLRLAGTDIRCVVEVGAADGSDTERYANAAPGARVLAFEPFPFSFVALQQGANRLPSITLVQTAVSDRVGRAEFNIGAWPNESSLLKAKVMDTSYDADQKATSSIEVELTTVDAACAAQGVDHIDLLKMDAQGTELKILLGAQDLLQREAIRLIYSEVHFNASYAESALFHDVSPHLHDRGFRMHGLYNTVQDQTGRLLSGDAIFVLRSASAALAQANR